MNYIVAQRDIQTQRKTPKEVDAVDSRAEAKRFYEMVGLLTDSEKADLAKIITGMLLARKVEPKKPAAGAQDEKAASQEMVSAS